MRSTLLSRAGSVVAAVLGIAAEVVAIAASSPGAERWNEAAVATVVVAYAAVGLLIVWHRRRHAIGRLALAIALLWGVGEALVAASYAVLQRSPEARLAALAMTLGTVLRGLPWLLAVVWLPLRFPDGTALKTRLARIAEPFAITTLVSFSLVAALSPTLTDLRVSHIDNPIGLPGVLTPAMGPASGINLLLGVLGIAMATGCLVQRYRRGSALDRQQTVIFGLAFLAPIAALVASFTDSAAPWLFGLASLPVPLAIGLAVLRRQLYDLPLLLNRSLTYATLSLGIAVLYAVTVGGVGVMLGRPGARWLPWLAAGIVAVSFAPLRDLLQQGANRITYGAWSRPADVLASTARRLGDATDVSALLSSLVDDIGSALHLPYVAIRSPDGGTLAVRGDRPADVEQLAMTSYGVRVGTLCWTRRPLRDSDRALLTDLARQLGTVVHAATLLEATRAAQERLVLAREEERRRLRRDLHDGLGPTLAALTLRVDTLRNVLVSQLRGGPAAAASDGLLELRSGIQGAVADVRRIVEGLRPPALDDLGLAEAVAQLAERTSAGSSLAVRVAADPLPRLPAAVEVATYRIVQESLTNTLRHAGARTAVISLSARPAGLAVEVRDDRCGEVESRPDGVGLTSMRERAEEIHGSFRVDARPGEGTTVKVLLPVSSPVESVAAA